MCLIAISPKGTDKYSDFFINALRTAAQVHTDGFGYGYKKDKSKAVYFAKGYMDINKLIDDVKDQKLKIDDELIVHLRMRSAGSVNETNTHPFELNYDSVSGVNTAVKGRTTIYPVMFHNGTFSSFSRINHALSDTYYFANEFMKIKGVWDLLKSSKEKFNETFKSVIGFNKLVFLSKETDMITIGDFITREEYIFSNTSFERNTKSFLGGGGGNNCHVKEKPLVVDMATVNNLNTNLIDVNEHNFEDFVLRSHCKSVSTGVKIEEGEYYTIKKFSKVGGLTINIMIEKNSSPGHFNFITYDILKAVFTIIPKPSNKKKWIDYIKLKANIEPTRSSVKKLYNKLISVKGRKKLGFPSTLSHKYKNTNVEYNFEAVLMFLKDHEKFVNKFEINNIIEELNEKNKVKEPMSNMDACC